MSSPYSSSSSPYIHSARGQSSRVSLDDDASIVNHDETPSSPRDSMVTLVDEKQFYVSQQPSSINGMSTTASGSGSSSRQGEWAHEECICVDPSSRTCLAACFCPCIIFGSNAQRLDRLGSGKPYQHTGCRSDPCMDFIPCFGARRLLDEQREQIRKRHGITAKEKWYHGIVASVCCAFPLTQHSEQIALEEGRGAIA